MYYVESLLQDCRTVNKLPRMEFNKHTQYWSVLHNYANLEKGSLGAAFEDFGFVRSLD